MTVGSVGSVGFFPKFPGLISPGDFSKNPTGPYIPTGVFKRKNLEEQFMRGNRVAVGFCQKTGLQEGVSPLHNPTAVDKWAMASNLRLDEIYKRKNRESAEIILADALRYGGEESLMVRWARLVTVGNKSIGRTA
jgi:hypothetical protein